MPFALGLVEQNVVALAPHSARGRRRVAARPRRIRGESGDHLLVIARRDGAVAGACASPAPAAERRALSRCRAQRYRGPRRVAVRAGSGTADVACVRNGAVASTATSSVLSALDDPRRGYPYPFAGGRLRLFGGHPCNYRSGRCWARTSPYMQGIPRLGVTCDYSANTANLDPEGRTENAALSGHQHPVA